MMVTLVRLTHVILLLVVLLLIFAVAIKMLVRQTVVIVKLVVLTHLLTVMTATPALMILVTKIPDAFIPQSFVMIPMYVLMIGVLLA
jgi:hypothetical protein